MWSKNKDMKKIVFRVEDNMKREDIMCTTYQMRNFYSQFHDGFFTNLDVMNYIQHYRVAQIAKKGMNIVDVCCGRSLMLPLLRYYAKDINSYTGIDISEKNIREAIRGVSHKIAPNELKTYYPFKVEWKLGNVVNMSSFMERNFADSIIYTSALEHMHPDMGAQSLRECYKIMKKNAIMFLSCPNTSGNGYNTQYRAHVYEWSYQELKDFLKKENFQIMQEVGLVMGAKDMDNFFATQSPDIQKFYQAISLYIPKVWLTAIMSVPYPEASKEILFIVKK